MTNVNKLTLKLLSHAPRTPDLAASNYFLFPGLRKWRGSKRFANNGEVEYVLMAILKISTILTINRVSKLLNIGGKSVSS